MANVTQNAKGYSFSIEPGDVNITWQSSSSGGSASARVSRAASLRSETIRIEHRPTGLSVEGKIPKGNYRKKHMQAARVQLKQELMIELDKKVAKYLASQGS